MSVISANLTREVCRINGNVSKLALEYMLRHSRKSLPLRVAACSVCVTAVWIPEAAQLELVNVSIVKWAESILGHSSLMPSFLTITLDCSKFLRKLEQHSTSPNFTPLKSELTYFLKGPAATYQAFTASHMLHNATLHTSSFVAPAALYTELSSFPLRGRKPQLMVVK